MTTCNGGANETTVTETAVTEELMAAAPQEAVADAGKTTLNAAAPFTEQKIIRTGHLRFESADLAATGKAVMDAVRKHKGQLQSDVENNDSYNLQRTMTVRLPSAGFDSFIADISKGVAYFDVKQISSEDVTEQYIDLDARVKAKKVLEARYLELIGKAKKVSEVLEIEKELSAIREEIEAKEGQLRYLKNRVALSTITVEFYKRTATDPAATVSYGSKMWNAVKSGFNGLSAFFIGLLHIWPFILIFVIVFYILRKKFRKRRHDKSI